MEVRFIGPLGKVTGSCTWMRDMQKEWSFLIDCGMQQGEVTAIDWNQGKWPFNPAEIKFVILTHAHIDHCGLIPALYRDGFTGRVICTKETAELAKISLADAARFPNAPFQKKHIKLIQWHEPQRKPLLGKFHPIDQDLYLQFYRSGHVVGAVSVTIYWGPKDDQKKICFSGDVGPGFEDHENLPLLRFNMNPHKADYAVIESTYGATVRTPEQKSTEVRRQTLRALLDQTLERNGTLVLPAFALGRTQNLMFDLNFIHHENPQKYDAVRFLIDSPAAMRMHSTIHEAFSRSENTTLKATEAKVRPLWLGKQFFRTLGLGDKIPGHHQRANEIIALALGIKTKPDSMSNEFGNQLAKNWKGIFTNVTDSNEREREMEASPGRPTVVIVSSGMCDGGPALLWIPHVLGDEKNHIALTGYCASGSVGRQLADIATIPTNERLRHSAAIEWGADGPEKFSIRDIRASISTLSGYSEHADQAGLLDWVIRERNGEWSSVADVVFIQHGDDSSRTCLADAIRKRAGDVGVAVGTLSPNDSSSWFDLDQGGVRIIQEEKRNELQRQLQTLQKELAAL